MLSRTVMRDDPHSGQRDMRTSLPRVVAGNGNEVGWGDARKSHGVTPPVSDEDAHGRAAGLFSPLSFGFSVDARTADVAAGALTAAAMSFLLAWSWPARSTAAA
jgi:hypothetical protein